MRTSSVAMSTLDCSRLLAETLPRLPLLAVPVRASPESRVWEKRLPIQVRIHAGKLGLIVSIFDQGDGFDLKAIARRFQNGTTYYHLAGNGMRCMIQSPRFGVFYTHAGRCFHLLYRFDGDPSAGHRPLAVAKQVQRAENGDRPSLSSTPALIK